MPTAPPVHKPRKQGAVKQISLYTAKADKLAHVPVLESPRLTGRGRQVRNAKLAWKNPLCVMCQAEGRVSRAEEWDHIIPLADGGADCEQNLQGLCAIHHAAKTRSEATARATGGRSAF